MRRRNEEKRPAFNQQGRLPHRHIYLRDCTGARRHESRHERWQGGVETALSHLCAVIEKSDARVTHDRLLPINADETQLVYCVIDPQIMSIDPRSGNSGITAGWLEADSLLTADKRKLNERPLLTNALTLQTTALLSCPDRQLLSHIGGKLTFVHLSVFWSYNTNVPTVTQVPIDFVQKSDGEYATLD